MSTDVLKSVSKKISQNHIVTRNERGQGDHSILLCLDFDLTLTLFHTFRYVIDSIGGGFSREDALLRAIKLIKRQGPKGGDELWKVLAVCLNRGHGIAVTSFTAFPELAQAMLASGLSSIRPALSDRTMTRWLSRPLIVFGDPAPRYNPPHLLPNTHLVTHEELSRGEYGKNLHIQAALSTLVSRGMSYEQVILMDDDPNNIKLAEEAGHFTVPVSREEGELSHLNLLLEMIS